MAELGLCGWTMIEDCAFFVKATRDPKHGPLVTVRIEYDEGLESAWSFPPEVAIDMARQLMRASLDAQRV